MKKLCVFALIFGLLASPVFAYDTGRSDSSFLKRWAYVEGRGILNLISMPVELIRTPVVESRAHKWIWPVSFLPRLVSNLISRGASSIYDVGFSFIVQPFTNDTTPLTEPLGLPDYGWQFNEGDF